MHPRRIRATGTKPLARSALALGRLILAIATALVMLGLVIPQATPVMPVRYATARDWNPKSFWFEPWGRSGVHKGIDIFAPKGQTVRSATPGVVVFTGRLGLGGNTVAVLGPRWRVHYYAHLDSVTTRPLWPLASGSAIGTVGTSGNAVGKPPHLHYAVLSLLPYPWRATTGTQGWKRMFYLDPGAVLVR